MPSNIVERHNMAADSEDLGVTVRLAGKIDGCNFRIYSGQGSWKQAWEGEA